MKSVAALTAEHFENRLGRLEHRFGHMEQRFGHLEVRFDRLDARFGHVEQRLDQMEQRFGHVESFLSERFERRLVETRVDVLKWSFVFWIGQVAAVGGMLTFALRSIGH